MLTSSKKNGGLYEILQHNYKDAEHILSVAAIPQIIEDYIYIDTIANEDIDKHPNVISYDYYVCGLNIGNEEYTVKAVISNMTDGTRYYDHKLTNIEKGKLIDIINKAPNSSVSIPTQTPKSNALSAVKDTRIISILQTNSSKVVDKNGEPMVVYHGSYWKPLEEAEGKAVFSTKYHPNIEQVRNYIVKVVVDGIEYYVRFTIHMQRNNNGLHSYFATDVSSYRNDSVNSLSESNLLGARVTENGIINTKLETFLKNAKFAQLDRGGTMDCG
jgi:hypothetical protein